MRVDLSDFFSDARRNTLIFIDSSWENINNVQDHIQKLFRVSNISLLTQDGCYLSPKESIHVLNSVESLKAFKLTDEELNDASVIDLNTAETGKKRKNRSVETEVEFSSSTPNNAKRSKSKHDTLQTTLQADTSNERRLTRKSANKYSMPETKEGHEEPEEFGVLEVCSINKTTATIQNCSQAQQETTTNDASTSFNSKNHIVYKDADTEVIPTLETSCRASKVNPDFEFHSSLIEQDNCTVRRFKLPRKPSPVKILEDIVIPAPVKAPQKNLQNDNEPLEAQVANDNGATEAEIPLSAKKLTSDNEIYEVEQECEVLEDNSTPETPSKVAEQSLLESDSEDDDVMVLDDTNLDDSNSADIITDMLRNAELLTTLPNVGETIIFKLTKTKGGSQSSSPKTEYISATCSYINRRTKAMTVSVIACDNATRQLLHQYRSSLDDSTDTVLTISVNFKELIEPKVIVSAVD